MSAEFRLSTQSTSGRGGASSRRSSRQVLDRVPDYSGDLTCDCIRVPSDITFPDPQDCPACPPQSALAESVPSPVRRDLGDPVCRVCPLSQLLTESAPVAAVPKVTVAKHG